MHTHATCRPLERSQRNGATPLHVACKHGAYDCARTLLMHGADANEASRVREWGRGRACVRLFLSAPAVARRGSLTRT